MQANDYQKHVLRTWPKAYDTTLTNNDFMLLWNVVGLCGESGEVADIIKKSIFHEHEFDREKFIKELGDVLWYLTSLASCVGETLSSVMQTNVEKLNKRYPNGFSVEDSINRDI